MINRLLYYKKMTMSIPEYCQLQRGETTLEEIYLNRKTRRAFDKMCSNKQIFNFLVFFFASILMVNQLVYAAQVDTSKIDELGNTLLSIVQSIGYWFCIIMAGKELIGSLMQGHSKDVAGIITRHILAFSGFYGLPWIFNLIKSMLA
ncbi:hypothetical protein ACSW8S_16670 (plasmid) [Clostridium perfringens]